MEDFKERLLIEKRELASKVVKLSDFVTGEQFAELELRQQELLSEQLVHMQGYLHILTDRIELLSYQEVKPENKE